MPRTTITIPDELLTLLDDLRKRNLIPRGQGLRRDNPAILWLATQQAKDLLKKTRVK